MCRTLLTPPLTPHRQGVWKSSTGQKSLKVFKQVNDEAGIGTQVRFSPAVCCPCAEGLPRFHKNRTWGLMQLRPFDTRGARHTRFTRVSEEMQFLCLFFPVTAGLSVPSQSKVTLPGPRKRDDMGRKIEESCGCL